ncbi:hypothetical protein HH214_13950 [Mucilaginibacter robiniae]|uniref:Tetratricopeptide repeat protein n=1 Tax=Mucilaginibacter robiniae TaxID=2728022 RepID=A0A7L5E935_9SPHI|nr:tetratricopeptide repeat protein [Mucilaginibacter robiniae]QJD96896.1 hypothetical protein HH214_13950 [Mucilaginibacter robiniae]
MFTNKVRLIVVGLFVLLLLFFVYQQTYELAAVTALFAGVLLWGYFKEGPIILAAKQFHIKNYIKAEELLRQIKKPEWLSKSRRGFYEFMLGGIYLQKQEFEQAEHHYELAAEYPLRSGNDHVAALVHIVNLNIRLGNHTKAEQYLQRALQNEAKATAKMKTIISRLQDELNTHKS